MTEPTEERAGAGGAETRGRMSFSDVIHLGLLGISTRKLRAVLSALGIAIGIATVIVVLGIPASSRAALLSRLSELGTNVLRAEPQPNQNPPVKLPKDAAQRAERIGPVTGAAMVANTHTIVRRNDHIDPNNGSGLSVLASSVDLLDVLKGGMNSGHFLTKSTSDTPSVVLGYVAAERLGVARVLPGRQAPLVYIGDRWFTVTGVLDPMPLNADLERAVLVGWGAATRYLDFDGHPTVVYTKAPENTLRDVRAVLAATLYPKLPGLVQVSKPSEALLAKKATESTFSSLFLGMAGVALLVGGIGVGNTMFISVLERRKEIGLRRALGATRGHIRSQFLTESVVLSGLGGIAGTALGVLATLGYALSQGWPPVIPPIAVVCGVGGAALVGALAGLRPSIRAARLTPTQALATT